MKEIERYLCAECAQNLAATGMKHERLRGDDGKKKPCAWCKRPCFGAVYRIAHRGHEHG